MNIARRLLPQKTLLCNLIQICNLFCYKHLLVICKSSPKFWSNFAVFFIHRISVNLPRKNIKTVWQSSFQWMKICSFYYSLLRVSSPVFLLHVFFLQQRFDSACSSRGKNINIKRWNQFIQLKGLTFKDRTTQCFCMLF